MPSTSTNPCSTYTPMVPAGKKIRSSENKPHRGSHTPKETTTDIEVPSTPWFLLACDPVKEFDQHMNVVYEMLDQVPIDEEEENAETAQQQINSEIK